MTRKEAELEAQVRWGETGDVVHLAQRIYQVGLWEKGPQGHMVFRVKGKGDSWGAALAAADAPAT